MPLIYVTSPVHASAVDLLAKCGDVVLGYGPDATAYDGVRTKVDAVLLRSGIFDEKTIAASPALRIIARHGSGVDTVDIAAATRRGIWVTNTPGANSRAVAEHVFALALSLARKIPDAGARIRNGIWSEDRTALNGVELSGRVLGLVGQGSIGREVAEIAAAFGMQVIVCDPALNQTAKGVVSFETLLREADVVSLHLPLLSSTKGLIDAAAIDKMKPGAILINTSRGGLVDEAAMADALRSGQLGGAGLDVLSAENVDMNNPLPHNSLPLSEVPNLIVTPHVGGQTEEALIRVGLVAVADIQAILAGGRPQHPVNDIAMSDVIN